jgi:hypothetical protein
VGVRPQQMRDAVLRTKVPSAELWMASFGSVGRSILRVDGGGGRPPPTRRTTKIDRARIPHRTSLPLPNVPIFIMVDSSVQLWPC